MTRSITKEHPRSDAFDRRAFLVRSGRMLGAGVLAPRSISQMWHVATPARTPDASEIHPFTLGTLQCTAVCDGMTAYKAAAFFANAPQAELAEALEAHHVTADHIPSPYTCLAVDTGRHRVLIDTGMGPVSPALGHLRANLQAAAPHPKAVDVVILTHAHPDHIGGLVGDDGKPVFPNAQYTIWDTEWRFWSDEANLAKQPRFFAEWVRKNLLPLRSRMRLVAQEQEVVPGVHIIPAPGHTPGHAVVMLESEGAHLMFTADAALHPIHLEHPDWYPTFDMDRQLAAVSRTRVFDRAATDGALVLAYHFDPFPSMGHVRRSGWGWQWEPI